MTSLTSSSSVSASQHSSHLSGSREIRWGMFLLGGTLAIGLVLASQSLGSSIARIYDTAAPIDVRGVASRAVTSDRASWSANIIARAKTLPEAYEAQRLATAALTTMLATTPLANDTIEASEITTRVIYQRNEKGVETTAVEMYVFSQRVRVLSNNVDAIADIARNCTSLIKEGIEIESGSPSFWVSSLEQLKLTLLKEATENAAERARLLAAGSSKGVGNLLSASQGVFQIVPEGSTDVSDSGYSDTSTIRKNVRATVSLTYAIAQ